MATYDLGDVVTLTVAIRDSTGTLANAGAVTATITLPDATVAGPFTATNTTTGNYQYLYTPTQVGRHTVNWIATGANAGAEPDVFDVHDPAWAPLVNLSEVKAHLRIPSTDLSNDDALRRFLYASRTVIEDLTGIIAPTTFVEYFDGGVQKIVVSHQPLQSVTSVYEYYGLSAFLLTEQPLGSQSSAFAFTTDLITGQITRRTYGGQAAVYAVGDKNIKVTYVAGYTGGTIPWNVRHANLELVRHWWQMTQQPSRRLAAASEEGAGLAAPGFAVPNFVIEMLQPHRRPPGVA